MRSSAHQEVVETKGSLGAPVAPPAGRPVAPGRFGGRGLPVLVALLAAVVVGLVAWTVLERWGGDSGTRPLPERAGGGGAGSPLELWDSIAFVRGDGIYVMRPDGSGVRALLQGGAAEGARDLAWSPDGGRLAFASADEIWVMNADGGGLVRVVDSGARGSPTWSPDGRSLAYDAEGIWVVNADGSGQRLLVRKHGAMLDWSPDGRRIAFVRLAEGWLASLYVIGVDGRGLRSLTPGHAMGLDPDWSPDGRWIAFRRTGGELYLTTPDGSSQRQLTRTSGTVRDGQPSWSPEGARIVFVRSHWRREPGSKELYVMNADGSGLRRLTTNGVADHSPAWRPAPGRMLGGGRVGQSANGLIAFARAGGIYAMRADGTGVRALRRGGPAAAAKALAWSPDGRRLAFLSGPALWVMDADGRRLVRLAGASGAAGNFVGAPTWSPDGALVAYTTKRVAGSTAYSPTAAVDRDIWVVNADGSYRRPLRRTPGQFEVEVDWSPVGGLLAYTDLTGYTSRIRVVRTSGLDERLLTWEWDFQALDPHWAPDGSTILFMHIRDPMKAASEELYLLDPLNGERRQLTLNTVADRDPGWSPDGRKIVFVRDHGESFPICLGYCPLPERGGSEIYVMNADGSGAVRLTHNRLRESDPAWQPVSR